MVADNHIATGGAAALNRMRSVGRPLDASRAEIARLSIATIKVPAAGPKTTALVSVNTSEIEKFTATEGIFSTADPLSSVSKASAHHSRFAGWPRNCASECTSTMHPAITIARTYGRARDLAAPGAAPGSTGRTAGASSTGRTAVSGSSVWF